MKGFNKWLIAGFIVVAGPAGCHLAMDGLQVDAPPPIVEPQPGDEKPPQDDAAHKQLELF